MTSVDIVLGLSMVTNLVLVVLLHRATRERKANVEYLNVRHKMDCHCWSCRPVRAPGGLRGSGAGRGPYANDE